jgi:hypothetical protein
MRERVARDFIWIYLPSDLIPFRFFRRTFSRVTNKPNT